MAAKIEVEMVIMLGIGFGPQYGGEPTAGGAMGLAQQPSLRRCCRQPIGFHNNRLAIGQREPHDIERIGKAVLGDKPLIATIAVAAHHRGAGRNAFHPRIERRIGIGVHVGYPVGQRSGHGAIGGHRAR